MPSDFPDDLIDPPATVNQVHLKVTDVERAIRFRKEALVFM